MLAGSGQPTDRWVRLAVQATAAVGRRLPPGVADGWAGRVVVEVPATVADFAAVLGQPAEAYAGIAAVAYQAGVGEAAPLRIVVNPRARAVGRPRSSWPRYSGTRSSTWPPGRRSRRPRLWAVEGLAEWVAVGGQPGRSSSGTADLLAEVRRDGPPRSLPADADFAVASPELNRAYAEAWLACSLSSPSATRRPGSAGSTPSSTVAGPLDQASRAVLGIGAEQLTADWRRLLVAAR